MDCLSKKMNSKFSTNQGNVGSPLVNIDAISLPPTNNIEIKKEIIKEEIFIEDHFVEVDNDIDCSENDCISTQELNFVVQEESCAFISKKNNMPDELAALIPKTSSPKLNIVLESSQVDSEGKEIVIPPENSRKKNEEINGRRRNFSGDGQSHKSRRNVVGGQETLNFDSDKNGNSNDLQKTKHRQAKQISRRRKNNEDFVNKNKKSHKKQKSGPKTKKKKCFKKLIVKKLKLEDFKRKERKELKCEVCSSVYNLTRDLDLHSNESGHYNTRKKCSEFCSKTYYNQEDLKYHQRLCIYSNIKCKWCKKVLIFRTISSYYRHFNDHKRKQVIQKRNSSCNSNIKQDYTTKYKCAVCLLVFARITEFRNHSEKEGHVNLPSFQCEKCPNKYYLLQDLKFHDSRKHGNFSQNCTLCNKEFTNRASYIVHVKRNRCSKRKPKNSCKSKKNIDGNVKKKYDCPECEKSFNSQLYLDGHLNFHKGEKPFKCDECGAAFVTNQKLIRHKGSHLGKLDFECQICHSQFSKENGLLRHMKMHNKMKEMKFKCNSCDKMFIELRFFIAHQIDDHGMQSPFVCKHCKRIFSYRKDLNDHLEIVHDEKSDVKDCHVCGKVYKNKCEPNLLVHVLNHLNVSEEIVKQVTPDSMLKGSYQCEECGIVFTFKNGLNRHWNTTHAPDAADRRFTCDVCGKEIADGRAFRRHKIAHERKFICEVCGNRYSENRMLQRHRKKHFNT